MTTLTTSLRRLDPGAVTVALAWIAIAVTFLSVTIVGILTLPWVGTADAFDHLDYVYQVSQGQLPQPVGHEWTTHGEPSFEAKIAARQFSSAHPPLWYAIGAALVGDTLAGPDWRHGVLVLRLVNTAIGLAGLAVLAWAGWTLGYTRRVALAITLPAIGGFTFYYLRFSAEVYNDLLVTLLSLLAVTISCRLIQGGISARLFVPLVIVSTLGFGTKATFVLSWGVAVVAVVVAGILHRRAGGRRWYLRPLVATGVLLAVPIAVFGWFYVRNAELSGAWYRSTPKAPVGTRQERSLVDNLVDPDFYTIVPRALLHRGTTDYRALAESASVALFAVLVAITIAVVIRWIVRRKQNPLTPAGRIEMALLTTLILGHLAGSYVLQLSHASGYGAYNWRYFLPSTISIAIILGLGIAALPRARIVLIPAAMTVLWGWNLWAFVAYRADTVPGIGDIVATSMVLAGRNGAPEWAPVVGIVGAVAGTLALLAVLVARRATLAEAPRALED
ncbi:hypothetical protein [Marisediminicola sp. LYQ134]|uniref:hypothetical protein n=1 Tax=Marisediminicola sp. LYQ134 TaxID=3391061 RepID=UPI0039831255